MILRRQRSLPSSSRRRIAPVAVRALCAALIAVAPVAISLGPVAPAGAQATPESVGIATDVVTKAEQSIGVVVINKRPALGWIGGSGVVVTSDQYASEVGLSAKFARVGSRSSSSCYVALRIREKHLSVLRCAGLRGNVLGVDTTYPAPGTPVFVVAASTTEMETNPTLRIEGGVVTANDIDFMKSNRLQFSFLSNGNQSSLAPGILSDENQTGAVVLNGSGKVVSTILAAPVQGGQPLGLIPSELTKAITKALPLPASFSSAAVVTVGKRALIPVAIGLVVGLIWGFRVRNGTTLTKCLGCAALGIVSAVVYTFFTVLVVGPQTLVG